MPPHSFDLIGVGNPIMDFLAPVPEAFLAEVTGAKGGMVLVEAEEIARVIGRLGTPPAVVPGGAAANATLGATQLGLRTTFLGKIGNDATAEDYRSNFAAAGGDSSRFKRGTLPHGRCLSLVTPDSQRTMRTYLGAAVSLHPDEITVEDFRGARHAHIEGYLMFNPALAEKVTRTARAAGCTVSLDLASFEIVNLARDWIFAQLEQGVQVVFANEDEVRALYQTDAAYPDLARRLAQHGGIGAVKVGKDGAWIAQGRDLHRIDPVPAPQVRDTTGAGDAWAGGFLYGWLQGAPLPAAGAIASLVGGESVQHLGPAIPESRWEHLRSHARRLTAR